MYTIRSGHLSRAPTRFGDDDNAAAAAAAAAQDDAGKSTQMADIIKTEQEAELSEITRGGAGESTNQLGPGLHTPNNYVPVCSAVGNTNVSSSMNEFVHESHENNFETCNASSTSRPFSYSHARTSTQMHANNDPAPHHVAVDLAPHQLYAGQSFLGSDLHDTHTRSVTPAVPFLPHAH